MFPETAAVDEMGPDASILPFSFQALMADAVKTPNVVEATNKPGLYDKLEMLKKRWVPIRPSEV